MANIAEFDSSNFTAADSPVILDVKAALNTSLLRVLLICDGPGTIGVASSHDAGATFTPDFPLGACENVGALLTGLNQIRLTHTGVDSSYRVLGQAGAAEITFNRTGIQNECELLGKHHEFDTGEVQVVSGKGVLVTLYNEKIQALSLWDHDGVLPADADLIAQFQNHAQGHIPFGFPFVNGLRIDSNGMGYVVHYKV